LCRRRSAATIPECPPEARAALQEVRRDMRALMEPLQTKLDAMERR